MKQLEQNLIRVNTFQLTRNQSINKININTPRTQQACEYLGIEIKDLILKDKNEFAHPIQEVQQIKYEHYLKNFKSDVQRVIQFKKMIFEGGNARKSMVERSLLGIFSTRDINKSSHSNFTMLQTPLTQKNRNFLEFRSIQGSPCQSPSLKQKNDLLKIIELEKKRKEGEQKIKIKDYKIKQAEVKKKEEHKKKMQESIQKNQQHYEKIKQLEKDRKNYQKALALRIKQAIKEAEEREKKLQEEKQNQIKMKEQISRQKQMEIQMYQKKKEEMEQQNVELKLQKIEQKLANSSLLSQQKVQEKSLKAQKQLIKVQSQRSFDKEQETMEQLEKKLFQILQKQTKANTLKVENEKQIKMHYLNNWLKQKQKLQQAKQIRQQKQKQEAKKLLKLEQELNKTNWSLIDKLKKSHKDIVIKQEKFKLKEIDKERVKSRGQRLQEQKKRQIVEKIIDTDQKFRMYKEYYEQNNQYIRQVDYFRLNMLQNMLQKEKMNIFLTQLNHNPENDKIQKQLQELQTSIFESQTIDS